MTIATSAAASAAVAGASAEAGSEQARRQRPLEVHVSRDGDLHRSRVAAHGGAGAAVVGDGVAVVEPAGARDDSGDDGSAVGLQPAAAPPSDQREHRAAAAYAPADGPGHGVMVPPATRHTTRSGWAPWADDDTLGS